MKGGMTTYKVRVSPKGAVDILIWAVMAQFGYHVFHIERISSLSQCSGNWLNFMKG